MAHYSIRWLGSAEGPDDMEVSSNNRRHAYWKARKLIVKLFAEKNRGAFEELALWLHSLNLHPPKTYAAVVTFEKILPGLGRFFIYCYKGDGRR